MEITPPYLLFLGDARDTLAAKTARGIAEWRPEICLGQLRLPGCVADAGLPDLTLREAVDRGARTLVIGVVNSGGVLPEHWVSLVVEALGAGLDVASGLHTRLSEIPEVAVTAARLGRALHDVRHADRVFETGKGDPRSGRRVLTVGTDCSVGKKYTALALHREMRARGLDVDFRATGQTGILIAGSGVAVDAVPADFIAGAAEWLSPEADADHWDVIEGQGSLFHPAFAGVSLGLLHGAQPEAVVLCHEPTRKTMRGVARALPDIDACIEANLAAGRVTRSDIRCAGIAVDTSRLDPDAAERMLADLSQVHGLPVADPMRDGVAALVDALLAG
jgi:uncharacterized NAD-dependent epimerase/dehydratase family protein